jgi:REP element-mobilizing transposase RayT
MPIFQTDADRIVMLSILAEACECFGIIVHAFALMTTHFHLLIEDPRGMLPHFMHRVQGAYARYFNDTRVPRRTGPVFDDRYRAELVDTQQYFEDAAAYVLLNPVRTQVPMAPSAESYRWSSAALVTCELTQHEFCARLLEPFGGVEGALAMLPPGRRPSTRKLQRARMEALASGRWIERDHVLAGRSPEQYRQLLARRTAHEPGTAGEAVPERSPADVVQSGAPGAQARIASPLMHAQARRFSGFSLQETKEPIWDACARVIPASLCLSARRLAEIVGYALWRFTSASAEQIGSAVGVSAEAVREGVRRARRDRARTHAWPRLFWTLEWGLRWRLGAAPHRA